MTMPFKGEFASYRPLRRLAETRRVKQLLRKARVHHPSSLAPVRPLPAPPPPDWSPELVVAVDGSRAEVPVATGYPGARVGCLTVASVMIDMARLSAVDAHRPVDPKVFRTLEKASAIDAALPGCNVTLRDHGTARGSFREALFELLHDADTGGSPSLLDTYEALLALKPRSREASCPYRERGCARPLAARQGSHLCGCSRRLPVYSTDALRIHEGFRDFGSNEEALSEVIQVIERLLVVHLLRGLEQRQMLDQVHRLAFFVDGPLAIFGHPAWLSAALQAELTRLNAAVRAHSGRDLVLVGIEKSGHFVEHFEALDATSTPGEERFPPRSFFLPTDTYIKQRVQLSDSPKRYGEDTYFGRKFFYKSRRGARIVGTLPFLSAAQDTLDADDGGRYPSLPAILKLLDELASSRYPNALAPLVTAHAHAAIPLGLGARVLEQLATALMRR